jgi:hypothetical protein
MKVAMGMQAGKRKGMTGEAAWSEKGRGIPHAAAWWERPGERSLVVVSLQVTIFSFSKETVAAEPKAVGSTASREEPPCVWKAFAVAREMTDEALECGWVGRVGRNFEEASPSPAR